MCGRYLLISPVEAMRRLFDVGGFLNLPPRYNIAPTQEAPVVRLERDGGRELVPLRWGLIPSWVKDPSIGNRLINARGDTVADKPAFRTAFQQRRCLVPADGFYEWQARPDGKQPYRIGLADDGLFAFAGLWEWWKSPEGESLETYTIITTDANDLLRPIHGRMPVIIDEGDHARWLDPKTAPADAKALLKPFPSERMRAVPVSRRVNNVRNDDPDCIAPLVA
jgi:putative SOS response-associated peptidase YedK